MGEYNPFGKEFRQLQVQDLEKLRTVSEGWYVEYKGPLPLAKNIAKSVSALANTHGGWLWYGVSAPSGSVGCAEAFPGLVTADVPATLERIRDAVASHLNPHPHFETSVFNGPCEQLHLEADRSIVAVRIPAGHYPPYVHSAGVIYVRVGDRSDPVPEADRGRLQQLFARAQQTRRELKKFLRSGSENLQDVPHVQLFVLPDPYDERGWRHSVRFADFVNVMRSSGAPKVSGGLPSPMYSVVYSEIQSVRRGFLARSRQQQLTSRTSSFRFTRRGEIVLTQPLTTTSGSRADVSRFLRGYDHAERFVKLYTGDVRVIDVSLLYLILADALFKARRLRELCKFPDDTSEARVMGTIRHAQGTVPFIDTEWFIEHCDNYGLPIVADDESPFPSSNPDDAVTIKFDEESAAPADVAEQVHAFAAALLPCVGLVEALGVPVPEELFIDVNSEAWTNAMQVYPSSWITLLNRALQVQQNREAPITRS